METMKQKPAFEICEEVSDEEDSHALGETIIIKQEPECEIDEEDSEEDSHVLGETIIIKQEAQWTEEPSDSQLHTTDLQPEPIEMALVKSEPLSPYNLEKEGEDDDYDDDDNNEEEEEEEDDEEEESDEEIVDDPTKFLIVEENDGSNLTENSGDYGEVVNDDSSSRQEDEEGDESSHTKSRHSEEKENTQCLSDKPGASNLGDYTKHNLLTFKTRIKMDFLESDESIDSTGQPEETHLCQFCGKLILAHEIFEHYESHPKKKDMCFVCNKRYSSKTNCRTHMKIHEGKREFVCDFCKKTFLRKDTLIDHRKIHTGEKNFKCKICGLAFIKKQTLVKHIPTHMNGNKGGKHRLAKERPCHFCKTVFNNESGYYKHICVQNGKDFLCIICRKVFMKKEELLSHQKSHWFTCETCCKVYYSQHSFKLHGRQHQTHTCKVCYKVYPSYYSYTIHTRKHTRPAVKKKGEEAFPCNECDKQFATKHSLMKHMVSHSSEKPWECPVCHKRFNQKWNLIKHERLHTDTLNYQCEYCNRLFNEKANLARHIKLHTGDLFGCTQCDKKYNTKYDLAIHEKKHTGVRDCVCTVCSRAFFDDSQLKKHFKIHIQR